MADDPAREHVGAVADARAHAVHRGSRHADIVEIEEPRDPGAILAEARIVEDQRMRARRRTKVGSDDAAVRARDQHLAGDIVQAGNAVGGGDLNQGLAGWKTRKYWFGRNACSRSSL